MRSVHVKQLLHGLVSLASSRSATSSLASIALAFCTSITCNKQSLDLSMLW